MRASGIVRAQRIRSEKVEAAHDLRRRMTREERLLWTCLRGNRLEGLHFRRQQVIDGLIVDFYCDAAQLVVEVDGRIHEAQVEYDRERDHALGLRGLRVLHVPDERVEHELPTLLVEIAAECKRRMSERRT
jgi:very-short-patch-repair endonuclease